MSQESAIARKTASIIKKALRISKLRANQKEKRNALSQKS